ncbi:hypothetical protein EVAR_78244_1 [Eumeta japonica]|uniref:Histone-lysine N-methyltransferase SETMAR n=1 Tax=Eumeta variegata TaxID=151549 RepID=A0A4C1T342_EUMVA|nr:hypothetical protein EVAR_78244_1 [Eumeta japonica]
MTIYNWFAEIKRGRVNLSDKFRDGRPSTALNNKNIDAVRRIITDRHVTNHEIQVSLHICISQIKSILCKNLDMKKLCSRWILHNLHEIQKTDRVTGRNAYQIKRRASNLIWNIATGYKTWIYCYDLKTKQQSTIWVS